MIVADELISNTFANDLFSKTVADHPQNFAVDLFTKTVADIKDLSSPQCQPNQTYCTAGESLLTWCAGLWARAQACHWNRQKK